MCCSLGQITRREGCHVWPGRKGILAGLYEPQLLGAVCDVDDLTARVLLIPCES